MRKGELIDQLVKDTGESKSTVTRVMSALVTTIQVQLKKGNTVGITGFGTFKPIKRAARVGRNPSTGAVLKISASKSAKFAIGATFKSLLNPSKK